MKFRTEVEIPFSEKKINPNDPIFTIGSCFANEISQKLLTGQMQVMSNPFGILFNPFSICLALEKICGLDFYTENDFLWYNDDFFPLELHSSLKKQSVEETLFLINSNIEKSHNFLKKTPWVVITYGTSFVYHHKEKKQRVSNCYKIPQNFFFKELLSYQEVKSLIIKSIEIIQNFSQKEVQILFTISPVRHLKDGVVENQNSKSLLISALHDVLSQSKNCHYLPIYEIMMDELRDYRFYKEDMLHPTEQSVTYIFDKFIRSYASDDGLNFILENLKISQALKHRPFNEKSKEYQDFLLKIKNKINVQQKKVNYQIFSEYRF